MSNVPNLYWLRGFSLASVLLFSSQCRNTANYKATSEEKVVKELQSGSIEKADGKSSTEEQKEARIPVSDRDDTEMIETKPSNSATDTFENTSNSSDVDSHLTSHVIIGKLSDHCSVSRQSDSSSEEVG